MGGKQSKQLRKLSQSSQNNRQESNEPGTMRLPFGKKKTTQRQNTSSPPSVSSSTETETGTALSPTVVATHDHELDPPSLSPCIMSQSFSSDMSSVAAVPLESTMSFRSDSISSTRHLDGIITPPASLTFDSSARLSNKQQAKMFTSQDLVLDLYLGPDSENERKKEKDRQQRLHYLLKKAWKVIYRAELKDPQLIVHWCCGIGVWDMEMAELFPNAKVVGIDFKEATFPNLRHGIPNLDFQIAILQGTMTGLESFKDNSVDYIMIRDVWLMNAPVSKWNNILNAAFRVLKPGGSIELSEHTLTIKSESPDIKKLQMLYNRLFEEIEVDNLVAPKLGGFLARSGFTEVVEESIAIPLGEWPASSSLREMGYLFRDLIERRVRGLEKWVALINQIDRKELSDLVTKSLVDDIDKHRAYIDWFSYTAKKPT